MCSQKKKFLVGSLPSKCVDENYPGKCLQKISLSCMIKPKPPVECRASICENLNFKLEQYQNKRKLDLPQGPRMADFLSR